MAAHTSILAWKIPWTEKPGGLHAAHGLAESDVTEQVTHTHRGLWRALCLFKMHKYLSNKIYTSS